MAVTRILKKVASTLHFHDCGALNKLVTALKLPFLFLKSQILKVIQRGCLCSLLPFLQHSYNDQCSLHWNAKTNRQYPITQHLFNNDFKKWPGSFGVMLSLERTTYLFTYLLNIVAQSKEALGNFHCKRYKWKHPQ